MSFCSHAESVPQEDATFSPGLFSYCTKSHGVRREKQQSTVPSQMGCAGHQLCRKRQSPPRWWNKKKREKTHASTVQSLPQSNRGLRYLKAKTCIMWDLWTGWRNRLGATHVWEACRWGLARRRAGAEWGMGAPSLPLCDITMQDIKARLFNSLIRCP